MSYFKNTSSPIHTFVERFLILLILGTLVAGHVLARGQDSYKIYKMVSVLSLAVLALYYSALARQWIILVYFAFFAHLISELLFQKGKIDLSLFRAIDTIFWGAAAFVFLYKSIAESLKNKDLEVLSTILGLFLLYPPINNYLLDGNIHYITYCQFAIAFTIGTILYNDNLYDKYTFGEKKLLLFLLVLVLYPLIKLSLDRLVV